jgi:hypothetical protein
MEPLVWNMTLRQYVNGPTFRGNVVSSSSRIIVLNEVPIKPQGLGRRVASKRRYRLHIDVGSYPQLHPCENFKTRKNVSTWIVTYGFMFHFLDVACTQRFLRSAKWAEWREREWADWFSLWLVLKIKHWTQPDAWSWRTDIAHMSHSRVGEEGAGQIWTLLMEIIMIEKYKWVQIQSSMQPVSFA